MSNKLLKRLLLPIIFSKWSFKFFSRVYQRTIPVFVFHQFGPDGHDIDEVIEGIQFLKKQGFQFLTVRQLGQKIRRQESIEKIIVLTFDDGYKDQFEAAKSIYKKCNVPVSLCLISSLVVESKVPWDMRIKYAVRNTNQNSLAIELSGISKRFNWSNDKERHDVISELRGLCEKINNLDRYQVVNHIESQLLSETQAASDYYKPLDITELKEYPEIDIMPHTETHCVLANEDIETKQTEIVNSISQLQNYSSEKIDVFVYPLGKLANYDYQTLELMEKLNLQLGLSTINGYLDMDTFSKLEKYKYQIPRIGYPGSRDEFLITASWLGRLLENYDSFKLPTVIRNRYGSFRDFAFYYFSKFQSRLLGNSVQKFQKFAVIKRIVFVCTGNICRSPFAFVVAERLGLNVDSVGLHAKSGTEANYNARQIALKLGYDLSTHKSKNINDIQLSQTDLLLAFEPKHIDEIIDRNIHQQCQIGLVGQWLREPTNFMADPYGKSDKYFENCFYRIIDAIDNLSQDFKKKN